MQAVGSLSLGFMMYVLPQMSAMGNIHRGIMAGKLKGAMPAHTPRGTLEKTKVLIIVGILGSASIATK